MQRLCHMRWTLSVGATCTSLFLGAAQAWAQAGDAAPPQLEEKPATIIEAIGRMRTLGCTMFLGVPYTDDAKAFIDHFTAAFMDPRLH